MNQDPKRWSTNPNAGSGRNTMNKMTSTNSDDGDYDLDERGGMSGSTPENSGHPSGDKYNRGANFDADFGGGEQGYGEEMQLGGNDPVMFCQPVGGDAAAGGGEARMPTFEEVAMEDDNHDGGDSGHNDGSDVSSAEKYADRNSDPGVHVQAEADYPLPNMPYDTSPVGGHHPGADYAQGGMGGGMAMQTATMGLPPNLPSGTGGGGGAAMAGGESVSLGTHTQTHEVRMPMTTTTFKPATGCTNASDFIVRCFVARLRSGITVVKHGRSRWCKSRLRVLHVHPDGRSLSWKPALGEPSSGKRPPKLDLTSCREVRHAWSPDPDNPMFTGTPILRQKCEAANAHKSFALIFPKRTVDITAVTADQCKVLMEGFSALCFRLQVAQNVAGTGAAATGGGKTGEEDKATTASVTLTNTSMRQDSPKRKGGKKRSFR